MPFELIVQDAFTERLPDNGVRVRLAGEHITDADHVEALSDNSHVVKIWTDDPPSDPAPAKSLAMALKPAPLPPVPAPAPGASV